MRILMVGAGATGGYFGGRLAQAGRDITFLVRGERLRQLQRDGLRIVSPYGDVTLAPKLIEAAALAHVPRYDVVIVSTKAYSLEAAMPDFAPAAGPETMVIPILNGMRHLDVLRDRFEGERVLGGSVRIIADMDSDGRVVQMTELNELSFGELDGTRTKRAERLLDAFSVPGIKATLTENILATMWQKWWFLASIGALCVTGRGSIGEIAMAPYGPETARALVQETLAIAAVNGYPADPKVVEAHIRRVTEQGSTLTSSMYRDMLKGAPVEADQILGDLLARGNGVDAPLLKAAYMQLKVYEAPRARA